MRKLFTTVAVLLVAGTACGQFKANQTSTSGVQTAQVVKPQSLDDARRISRDEAVKMVKEGKAVFIDVRDKSAYDAGHITGAVNMPLGELLTRLRDLPPKKFLITYCA